MLFKLRSLHLESWKLMWPTTGQFPAGVVHGPYSTPVDHGRNPPTNHQHERPRDRRVYTCLLDASKYPLFKSISNKHSIDKVSDHRSSKKKKRLFDLHKNIGRAVDRTPDFSQACEGDFLQSEHSTTESHALIDDYTLNQSIYKASIDLGYSLIYIILAR